MLRSLALALALAPGLAHAGLASFVADAGSPAEVRRIGESRSEGVRETIFELESQVWQGEPWRHELRVFRADAQVPGPVAVLVVGGSRSRAAEFSFERRLAVESRSIVALLSDVPNQPLFGRSEDDLVAHTFGKFLETGDESWPVLLPMAKAAVRAMDAVAELSGRECGTVVERFVVTGASKRGWTSWLAAAADPRVAGIVPVVFDNLSFAAELAHQVETWGRYSPELVDYNWRGLEKQVDTERGRQLLALVDPYAYRDRLASTAKLVVNGTNDPYWVPDAIQQYWSGLAGEKAVLYVPNGTHSIAGDERVLAATAAFVRRVARRVALPAISLDVERSDAEVTTRLVSSERPVAARLWIARSDTQDFRAARFTPIELTGEPLQASFVRAKAGFYASFAEADFRDEGRRFRLSTPLVVQDAAR